MPALAEVEKAACMLPVSEQRELFLFLLQNLRANGAPLPAVRVFSDEQLNAWMDEDEEDMRRFQAGA